MMTMFELYVGEECGGPEDGMMCREGIGTIDLDINLFQPIEQLYAEVEKEYSKLYGDYPEFLGCRVKRLVPEDEAKKIRELWAWEDEHCIDGNVYV